MERSSSTCGCPIESFHLIKFLISHGKPRDKRMLSELEPSEFDTPIPFSPFSIIVKLEMASGAQLPIARNVSPVIASGKENV